jgi:putative transposase
VTAIAEVAPEVGVRAACCALDVARASFYRAQKPQGDPGPRKAPPRALSGRERIEVLDVLHSERFVDKSPAEAWATLLDEETYLCSVRTMYRILEAHQEVRERRNQLRHPNYRKPELLATAPNQVWSWDITKLLGPAKWTYFYLYAILDIFSRYTVGWMVAYRESATLAQRLIDATCEKEAIEPDQLVIHADRGPSMTSKTVAHLMADLGITKSHSRPYTSTDNPFSESQFRTMKYRPEFPHRFGCVQDARTFGQTFFHWYNFDHRHSGIGYLTPAAVHHGLAESITTTRAAALEQAYAANPERFVKGKPRPPAVPSAVWINPPEEGGHSKEDLQ